MYTKDMKPQICLQAVTGSRAYGLDHAESDTDRMAVFVAPTTQVAGLYWSKHDETESDAGPEGDDTTLHEIGKFLRLTLKGNPTLIELYFMNEYEVLTDIGEALVSLRFDILSTDTVFDSYYNYAKAQIRMVKEREDFKPKMARHALRLARQGRELLETGSCNVHVGDPAEYFRLTEMAKPEMLDKLDGELEWMKDSYSRSVLPPRPDTTRALVFLERVRTNNILEELQKNY